MVVEKYNDFFLILSNFTDNWFYLQIDLQTLINKLFNYDMFPGIALHCIYFTMILHKTKSIIYCESCLINNYKVTEDCRLKTIMWNQYFWCEHLLNLLDNLLPSKGSGGSQNRIADYTLIIRFCLCKLWSFASRTKFKMFFSLILFHSRKRFW